MNEGCQSQIVIEHHKQSVQPFKNLIRDPQAIKFLKTKFNQYPRSHNWIFIFFPVRIYDIFSIVDIEIFARYRRFTKIDGSQIKYFFKSNGSQLKNPDITGTIFTLSLSIRILNSQCVEGARDVRVFLIDSRYKLTEFQEIFPFLFLNVNQHSILH